MAIKIGRIRVRLNIQLPRKAALLPGRPMVPHTQKAGHAQKVGAGAQGKVGASPTAWLPTLGASAGKPIKPEGVRHMMEKVFGTDFRDVRVHHDLVAGRRVRARKALAVTYGRHIYFATGEYQPWTARGRALLAHELLHVIEQRRGIKKLEFRLDKPDKHSEAEQKALKVEQNFTRQPRMKDPAALADVRDKAKAPANERTQQRWGQLELGMAKHLAVTAKDIGRGHRKLARAGSGRPVSTTFPKEVGLMIGRGQLGLISLFTKDRGQDPGIYFLARSQRFVRKVMPQHETQRPEGFQKRRNRFSKLYHKAWKIWRRDRVALARMQKKPRAPIAKLLRTRAGMKRQGLLPNEMLGFLGRLNQERKIWKGRFAVMRSGLKQAHGKLQEGRKAWGRSQPLEMHELLKVAEKGTRFVRAYDKAFSVLFLPKYRRDLQDASPPVRHAARWRGFHFLKTRAAFGNALFDLEARIRRHRRLGRTEPGREKRRKLLATLAGATERFHAAAKPYFVFMAEKARSRGQWPDRVEEARLRGAIKAVLAALGDVRTRTRSTSDFDLERNHHPWWRNRLTKAVQVRFALLGLADASLIRLKRLETRVRVVSRLLEQRKTQALAQRLEEVSRLSKSEAAERAATTGRWFELRPGLRQSQPIKPMPVPEPIAPVDRLPPGVSVPDLRLTQDEVKLSRGNWRKVLGPGGQIGWLHKDLLRSCPSPRDRSAITSQRRGDSWLLDMLERHARRVGASDALDGVMPIDDMPSHLRRRLKFLGRLGRNQLRNLPKGRQRALLQRQREQSDWLGRLEDMGIDGRFFQKQYGMAAIHRKAKGTAAIDRQIEQAAEALKLDKPKGGALVMDFATRGKLRKHLGVDPGDIRVHIGRDAAKLADELSADALAVGKNIFLAEGKARQLDPKGTALIAHEVTHTLQTEQTGLARQKGLVRGVDSRDSREAVAEAVEAEVERRERRNTYARSKRRMVVRDGCLEHGSKVKPLGRGPRMPGRPDRVPVAESRDPIGKVMDNYSIKESISSREFIDEMATRVMDLLAHELQLESDRREELEWGPFHRGQ